MCTPYFVAQVDGVFQFTHLSFQEALAAQAVVQGVVTDLTPTFDTGTYHEYASPRVGSPRLCQRTVRELESPHANCTLGGVI